MGQFVVNIRSVKAVRARLEGVVVEGTRCGENHPFLEVLVVAEKCDIASKKAKKVKMMLALGIEVSVESSKVKPRSIESP